MWKFLKRLATFGGPERPTPTSVPVATGTPEHAVFIDVNMTSFDLNDLTEVESVLDVGLDSTRVGMFDGHEVAVDGSHARIYLYGPDADAMFQVVKPVLLAHEVTATASVLLRFGDVDDPAARHITHQLGGGNP